jgi:hypothetical protein
VAVKRFGAMDNVTVTVKKSANVTMSEGKVSETGGRRSRRMDCLVVDNRTLDISVKYKDMYVSNQKIYPT